MGEGETPSFSPQPGAGPRPRRRALSGAWRLLAALVLLGLMILLLRNPLSPTRPLYQPLAIFNSPSWLWREAGAGFAAAGRAYAGAEVVPLEVRLVEKALREMGVKEFTMVGKMRDNPTLHQRAGEFIYPIVMRRRDTRHLVGYLRDVQERGARVVWCERGVAIGVVDK
jgi:hypothetical protein